MVQDPKQSPPEPSALQPSTQADPPQPPPTPPPPFDPSRMIGIIKRKALIKELAAAYHAECLVYCQELLELQRKWDEPFIDLKPPEDSRKEPMRAPKRLKKSR
ncbi:hypothetical protein FH972_000915 [Carpinus fangiana]|uniref:Uncharacterized protein n=1 Tax=Carpinus fangiana TaxID=176857 RepID=A0A5N6QA49_9ROSI|nr:hypothetical protein FH972_000915 [Carpinus fangiana]